MTGAPDVRPIRSAARFRFLLALGLSLACATPSFAALPLISRSAGLELPQKEEGCTELEVGDVNGDGNPDIVSVGDHGNPGFNSDEHGIMVWLGDGAGGWSVHQTGNFGYGGCALGDLDRDGRMDLAWGIHHNYGTGMGSRLISAARGDGTGLGWSDWGAGLATNGESWGMFATALADFNGDGLLDLVSESFGGSNGLQLYGNDGDGTWTPAWSAAGGSVQYTIESCDVDADGYADIACTRAGTNVFRGDGAFGFVPATSGLPSGTFLCIDAGDMNGDGRDDIVFGLGSSGLRCCTYAGGVWQDASSGLPASGTFPMCQFGDLDDDGDLDVIGYSDPTGRVYLGDGAGHWTADATWTMPSPGEFSALRVDGDLDHDGREDIVVQATQSGFPFYRNQLRAYSPWADPSGLSARVVSPRGGETLRIGSVRDVRWLAAVPASLGAATVEIRLSLSGLSGPWRVLGSGLPDNGRFQWLVDAEAPSETCRLRITVTAAQESVVVTSPADFRIALSGAAGVGDGRIDGAPDALAERTRLAIVPNPARDAVEVRLGPEWRRPGVLDGGILLEIVDPAGRLIRRWSYTEPGVLHLPLLDWRGARLARGVYLLRVTAPGRASTARFIKE